MEGFGLTDEEQKNSPEEHAAGMQLSVLGVHLRPYIFFTGTSELMSLVWSGVGSEPTTAFQVCIFLAFISVNRHSKCLHYLLCLIYKFT